MFARRTFLKTLGGSLGACLASDLESSAKRAPRHQAEPRRFAGPLGLQLYSLRKQLPQNLAGTLEPVRKVGYTEVEAVPGFWGPASVEELRRRLDEAGLKCTSVHQSPDRLRTDLDGVVKDAKILGVETVVCGYISGAFQKDPLPLEAFARAAAEFNDWAAILRSAGLAFAYHNHDYEFRLYQGKPGFDLLLNETKPGVVEYEMDVFWVKRGGQDPVDYLLRSPDRFRLLHLKDMRRGTPMGDFAAGTSDEASVPLGTGILDMLTILREAAKVAVRRYYVEDESAEAPQGIQKSAAYLRTVRF